MTYGHQVSRRWLGLLVLLMVVLGAAAATKVAHQQVAGTAHMAPVPGPPSVGDCLLEPIGGLGLPVTHADVMTGPCVGRRYGEVVSVIPAAQVQPLRQDVNGGSAVDPNLDTCLSESVIFLGLGAGPGHPANLDSPLNPINVFTYWTPALITLSVDAAGPSALQTSMGQRWLACIGYMPDISTLTAMPYDRSARGTFTTGIPPAVYAVCLQTADGSMLDIINCSSPHGAELFGLRFFGAAATPRAALDATCTALIKKFTGMSDPSAGGRLTAGTVAAAGTTPADSDKCMVSAPTGHHLTGPSMNLGDKPLPLD